MDLSVLTRYIQNVFAFDPETPLLFTQFQFWAFFSLVFLAVMLLVFSFGMTQIKWYDTTSISAFRSYRSTQMGNYWHTYQQRLKILKDPEIKDAVLKRFPYRPYVLFFQELSTDPGHNTTIALWYGKNSVIIQ